MEDKDYVYVRVLGIPDKILVSMSEDQSSLYGKEVLIETEQGQYIGFVNSFPFKDRDLGYRGRILKEVDASDRDKELIIDKKRIQYREEIRSCVQELGLQMKVTHVQFTFDERTVTIFYTAPNRVDFRELLKVLKSNYPFKFILRQISEEERDACYHVDPRIM